MSKIEGKYLKLVHKPLDLVSILRSITSDFSGTTKRYQIENEKYKSQISFLCTYDRATAYGDKTRLEQVVRNLITNALNFTANGAITISLHKDNSSNEWVVSVKDTGQGIDPSIFPRLFTKFVTKSQHGIGLGLYISKNIIEAQGGRIWAENNKEGKGATFNFTLPISRD